MIETMGFITENTGATMEHASSAAEHNGSNAEQEGITSEHAPAPGIYSRLDSCISLPLHSYLEGSIRECNGQIIQEIEVNVLVNGRYVHTLTCSPWDVEELVVGYLFFKGLIRDRRDIDSVRFDTAEGMAEVSLSEEALGEALLKKRSSGSSLGDAHPSGTLDGATARKLPHYRDATGLQAIRSSLSVRAERVNSLAVMLEKDSLLFKRTGGVHSAILIKNNGVAAWFEDIGRHSAVDKLAGWCLLNDMDTQNSVLLFSGRVPYEIITKTIRLGSPIIISPGVPTNLSIDLAERYGVTLIGFAKDGLFNVYAHAERVLA